MVLWIAGWNKENMFLQCENDPQAPSLGQQRVLSLRKAPVDSPGEKELRGIIVEDVNATDRQKNGR